MMRRYPVSVTTAADGTVTAYSPRLSGKIHQIEYVKAASGGYAAASSSVEGGLGVSGERQSPGDMDVSSSINVNIKSGRGAKDNVIDVGYSA